jgi:excisionase family DNA binding protein
MVMVHRPPKTISVEDAAKMLNIGRNQAYEAARTGQIPVLRIGKRILVLVEPLERMLGGDGAAREVKAG